MADLNDKPSSPGAELDELRDYVSKLEARAVWAENEVQKLLAARSLRMAQALGSLRRAPLRPRNWASSILAALKPSVPELKTITRRRFDLLHNMARAGGANVGGDFIRSMQPRTAIEGIYQNTIFALEGHDRIAGVADEQKIKSINPSADFHSVRPSDFDHIMKKSKATAFVFDLECAAVESSYWNGIMSMTNVPISVTAAQCIQTARDMGMSLYLFSPENPHRFPLLSDVKPLFHAEIAYN